MTTVEAKSVFTWLDGVRARPGMYIPDGSLRELETLVHGYYAGLFTHGLIEPVPEMTGHFSTWLYVQTGWSTSTGWAHAITSNSATRQPLDVFFELVDRPGLARPRSDLPSSGLPTSCRPATATGARDRPARQTHVCPT